MAKRYRRVTDLQSAGFTEEWATDADGIARHIADTIPYILYVYDIEAKRSIYSNRQLGELLGYSSEDLKAIGKNFLMDLLHPKDRVALGKRVELWKKAGDGDILEFEYRLKHANGEWRWFFSRNKIFARDESGEVSHIIGSGEDITERKRAFEVSEQRFRLLAENLPGVVFLCKMDARLTMLYLNDEIENATGYTKEAFLDGRVSLVDLLHRRDSATIIEIINRAIDARQSFHVTYRLRHRSGEWRWFEEFATGVFDETSGELLFIEGFMHDITSRKRAEEEKERLAIQMQHTQKLESLGILAGGIAHDFNNLLMGIMGNATMALEDAAKEDPMHEILLDIQESARRASDLCNQLLAYSGKGKFVIKAIDLSRAVMDLTHLLDVSISKKSHLRMECAANLPAIEADPSQIQQVIMNLIINASDAFGDGPGTITVSTGVAESNGRDLTDAYTAESLPSGSYVWLTVADDGPGMDAKTQERIFDPFFTTKFTGRGLGLAAVLGIVRGHGGAIALRSKPGGGSTFTVYFPASDKPVEVVDAVHDDGMGGWSGEGSILVVDDDRRVLTLARRMLTAAGFTVITAADGHEGVDMFRKHADAITLTLLDMTMPGLSGDEVLEEIRALRPGARVIITSGFSEQEVTQRFVTNGFTAFIQKPYTARALYALIRQLLEEHEDEASRV